MKRKRLKNPLKRTDYDLDLMVDCPNKTCLAESGVRCNGLDKKTVHIGRRITRLMKFIAAMYPWTEEKTS